MKIVEERKRFVARILLKKITKFNIKVFLCTRECLSSVFKLSCDWKSVLNVVPKC
jgi:hypothetical protein